MKNLKCKCGGILIYSENPKPNWKCTIKCSDSYPKGNSHGIDCPCAYCETCRRALILLINPPHKKQKTEIIGLKKDVKKVNEELNKTTKRYLNANS